MIVWVIRIFFRRNILIDYMNNKTHRGNTILYGKDNNTEFDHNGCIEKRIGKIATVDLT